MSRESGDRGRSGRDSCRASLPRPRPQEAAARQPNAGPAERLERIACDQLKPILVQHHQVSNAGADNPAKCPFGKIRIGPEAHRDQEIGPPVPHALRQQRQFAGSPETNASASCLLSIRRYPPGPLQGSKLRRSGLLGPDEQHPKRALRRPWPVETPPARHAPSQHATHRRIAARAAAPTACQESRAGRGERRPPHRETARRTPANAPPADTTAHRAR